MEHTQFNLPNMSKHRLVITVISYVISIYLHYFWLFFWLHSDLDYIVKLPFSGQSVKYSCSFRDDNNCPDTTAKFSCCLWSTTPCTCASAALCCPTALIRPTAVVWCPMVLCTGPTAAVFCPAESWTVLSPVGCC